VYNDARESEVKYGGLEPEVHMKYRISQLADMIATQFQRLYLCLWRQAL